MGWQSCGIVNANVFQCWQGILVGGRFFDPQPVSSELSRWRGGGQSGGLQDQLCGRNICCDSECSVYICWYGILPCGAYGKLRQHQYPQPVSGELSRWCSDGDPSGLQDQLRCRDIRCDSKRRSQCPANYRDGAAAGSQAGCKTSCDAGTYVATANAACTSVGTGYYKAAHTVSYGSTSTRSQCPANYRDGAAASSQNNCIGIFEKTGGQNNPTKPTGCATMEYASSCTPPTCEYQKNYAGTVVKDCTPGNCTKAITKLTANADRYVNGTTSCPACSSYSSTYTKSDGGSITYNSCYITRSKTGSWVRLVKHARHQTARKRQRQLRPRRITMSVVRLVRHAAVTAVRTPSQMAVQ